MIALTFLLALSSGVFGGDSQASIKKASASSEETDLDGWKMIFNDEFDGTEVDTSKWNVEDWPSGRNEELQYYHPDDVLIRDGNLVIRSQKRDFVADAPGQHWDETEWEYTSGAVNTQKSFTCLYGKVEVKAKLPKGQGIWPAIWLNAHQQWPPEYDIIEYLGHEPNVLHINNHWGNKPNNGHVSGSYHGLIDFSEDFHVYGFEWDPGEIRMYVDGELIRTYTNSGKIVKNGKAYDALSNEEMYLILNTAVGGNWPGDPDGPVEFPTEFLIDYVRFYERTEDSKVLANIALNKSVTADSEFYGREASNAVDGNSKSMWNPVQSGTNHWINIDLGDIYDVNATEISFDRARNYGYEIETSVDGVDWSTVSAKTEERAAQPTVAILIRSCIGKVYKGNG